MKQKKWNMTRLERNLNILMFLLMIIGVALIFMFLSRGFGKGQNAESDEAYAVLETINTTTKTSKATKGKLDKSDWRLILVNKWNPMPLDYSVEIRGLNGGHSIDARIYPDLQAMMDDARALGLNPMICSSYRQPSKQRRLHEQKVREYQQQGYSYEDAVAQSATWVAVPGTSEHEVGLALDIVSTGYQMLDKNQENTPEQRWLMENSYRYGFILRYPEDKAEITGIEYEPWHYRYVGKDAAKEIYDKKICLEEYLKSK